MTKFLAPVALALGLFASSVFAAEQTVTLAVKNMYCAACPHTVKSSLEAVPGVANVVVRILTTATTNAGYPTAPKS